MENKTGVIINDNIKDEPSRSEGQVGLKEIATIMLGIFLIGLASAIIIPAGTSDTFQINTTDTIYYDIVGNSSSTEGMEISQDIYENYSNITIEIDFMYQADNFKIIFFNKQKEIIYEYRSGGSGGSSNTRIIYQNRTEYVDRIIDSNETIGTDADQPKEEDETNSLKPLIGTLIGIGIIAFLLFITWIIPRAKKLNGRGEEIE